MLSLRATPASNPYFHVGRNVVGENLLNYRYDTSAVINEGTINNM